MVKQFQGKLKNKDIDSILDLFAEEVEYHETPTRKLENRGEIRDEWESIQEQKDVEIKTEIYSSKERKHTVKWHLEYQRDG